MKEREATLVFLVQDGKVLLARKQKKIGAGKYNGAGGKLDGSETAEDSMIRETEEEFLVTPTKYEKVGEVTFHNQSDDAELRNLKVHTYIVSEWVGNPAETEEMKEFSWFDFNNVPYDQMMSADRLWLPKILAGKKIKALVVFDKNWNIEKSKIDEVKTI